MGKQFGGKSRGGGVGGFGAALGSRTASPSIGAFGSSSPATADARDGNVLSWVQNPIEPSTFVSDPHVIKHLKTLQKKDSITKARALEDLLAHFKPQPQSESQQDGSRPEVGEGVLDIWVALYPRLSIDNSPRVRDLSRNLLQEFRNLSKEAMAARIPKLIGPMLADRAANLGGQITSNLDAEKKLWKRYQAEILEYAITAATQESDDLSDPKTTSLDECEVKYHRVLRGGLSLVLGLLENLSPEETGSCRDSYDKFFSLTGVEKAATVADSFVRRQCFQLLARAAETQRDPIQHHLPRLSKVLLSQALDRDQTGSATQLVDVLTKLTILAPEIWGTKKPPLSRLRPFLEKGSQRSANFWESLVELLSVIPQEIISFEAAVEVLKALKTGIPRVGAPLSSATAYITTAQQLLSIVEPKDSRPKLATELIHPLIVDYIEASSSDAGMSRPAVPRTPDIQLVIAAKAAVMLAGNLDPRVVQSTAEMWSGIAERFVDRIRSALSEAPADFKAAQDSIAAEGDRLFDLARELHQLAISPPPSGKQRPVGAEDATKHTNVAAEKTLVAAQEILAKDNYRPFGAAAIVQSAIESCPFLFQGDDGAIMSRIFPISSPTQIESLLSSESAPYLLSALIKFGGLPEHAGRFKEIWTAVADSLPLHSNTEAVAKQIRDLLSIESVATLSQQNPSLQRFLLDGCLACISRTSDNWELFETCLMSDVLAPTSTEQLIQGVLEALKAAEPASALRAIHLISDKKPSLLTGDSDRLLAVATGLLSLSENSHHSISPESSHDLLKNFADRGPLLAKIVQENLHSAGPTSLPVDILVKQASEISTLPGVTAETLFPNTAVWMDQLALLLHGGLNPSLSLTSEPGGICSLAAAKPSAQGLPSPQRDARGLSIPARMALYTTKLLNAGVEISSLPPQIQVELLCLLCLVAEAVSDQIVLLEINRLWGSLEQPELLFEAETFVSSARKIINRIAVVSGGWKDDPEAETSIAQALIRLLMHGTRTLSPMAVYSARALSSLLQTLVETYGYRPGDERTWITNPDIMKETTPSTILPCVAVITGYGEALSPSQTFKTLLNRLISDITEASLGSLPALLTLILLNSCMSIYEVGKLPVANPRLVFAVKRITSWFDIPTAVDAKFSAEACRALQRLLPCIKDIYGSHWEKTLDFCKHLWEQTEIHAEHQRLSYLHASLKLIGTLETLEEPNDDLDLALQVFALDKPKLMIRLLETQAESTSHPAEIVNALLCRLVEKLPVPDLADLEDIYPLLAATSRHVQTAAFNILHQAIPKAQPELAVSLALDKPKDIGLPDELLSLLQGPPTLEAYPEELLATFPAPVRGYLLTWLVIFDAFREAAHQLRNVYSDHIKTSQAVKPLLDFTFDVLGHTNGKALNLDKEGFTADDHIRSYDVKLADSEPDQRNLDWLLIHVYYLVLKYLPGLVKTWYIGDCPNKRTQLEVEAWTTRFFSPTTVSEALDDVARWAETEEPASSDDADEKHLNIRVNKAAREVRAGYEVDETEAAIAIRLPASYPLESVAVVDIRRVAVSEKKWKAWLITTQGIITFASSGGGNLVDGLLAFRRNVQGELKGQTECAICYAIVSTDRRLPDKRCGTCRNAFHRSCLYQWFQVSSQNTCPLCRNPIDYLGKQSARRGADYWDEGR